MEPIYDTLQKAIQQNELIALATVVAGPGLGSKLLIWPDGRSLGDLGSEALNQFALQTSEEQFDLLESGRFTYSLAGEEVDLFIEVFPAPLKLIVNGAVHIAIPLIELAKTMGFYTVVIDARRTFATKERFPNADELMIAWPSDALKNLHLDESTYFVTLTHDDKLDIPALEEVLDHPVRYVGALGSTKTHANRVRQLIENGVSEDKIARIHAPIGLDLGAKGVEEIALSILAEMIAVRHGKESKKVRQAL